MNPLDELEALRAANRALEAAKAQWEAERRVLLQLKEGLEAQLQETLLEVAELKRRLFGENSEKLSPEEQAQLQEVVADLQEQAQREAPASEGVLNASDDSAEEAEEAPPGDRPQDAPKGRRKRPRRHPLPEHLERHTTVIEPPQLASCQHCGKAPQLMGEEVTERLDYQPAKVVVCRTVRPKYGCACGCGGVQIAPLPECLLPMSKLGLGLAVHLLLSRFDDHVAYYTLERIFLERHGVEIPRQQMVQWVAHVAFLLQPLYRLLFEHLKRGGYLQIDETPVKVLDPEVKGKCARGFLWFYAVPGADVFIDFQCTRARRAPQAQLEGFSGTIQSDGYEVYDSLKKVLPGLTRIGCAAHARRKFYQALKAGDRRALWFIGHFRKLYRIEAQCRDLTPDHRHEIRQREAPQLWEAMKQRAKELQAQPGVLPQSALGKALSYLINEYQALLGYLLSGIFEIDNNLVENSIRSPAVGRRRWLFIGHPDAGWRSAVIYTFIVSCRRRGINPQEYLTDVLRRLPTMNITQIADLLPGRWQPTVPQAP